jgi:thiol:disulfide interchange protein DsbC
MMRNTILRSLGVMLAVSSVLCARALWAVGDPGTSNDSEAAIKRTLIARYPKIPIVDIEPSAVPGIYEVFTGGTIVYSDRTGDHLFVGRLIETSSNRDLSAERLDVYNGVDFGKLPFERAIKIVKGNGSRRLAIFEDPDCPYCQRLEQELSSVKDLTVYVFLYPLEDVHPGATSHAHAIWCSPDRSTAWTEWMVNRKPPPGGSCSDDPIGANEKLGRALRINTTPTLFLPNGHRIRGVPELAALQQMLTSQVKAAVASRDAQAGGGT